MLTKRLPLLATFFHCVQPIFYFTSGELFSAFRALVELFTHSVVNEIVREVHAVKAEREIIDKGEILVLAVIA
jgi:hypothetical protein